MIKIILNILALAAISFAASVTIQKSHYDFKDKFKQENNTKIIGVLPKIGRMTVIGSVEDINRYGLNAQQYGGEIYSTFGEKEERMWGYTSLYLANENFLPKYDLAGAFYKGIFESSEIGFGYKRMVYTNSTIDIYKLLCTYPAIILPSTTIMHALSYSPKNETHSFNTKVVFNNEDGLKMFYSLTVGNTAEDFGFFGVRKIDQLSNIAGIDYTVHKNISIGGEFVKESYKDFYDKTGGNVFLRVNW